MRTILTAFIMFISSLSILAQENVVDIFIIDSYVTVESPHIFNLSFFTMEPASSEIIIDGRHKFSVSDSLAEDHSFNLNLDNYKFDSSAVKYAITVVTEDGRTYTSDENDFVLSFGDQLKSDSGNSLLTVCCFGGIIFGLPSVSAVYTDGETKLSLTKEIPILSFYSGGYNYPTSYLSLEYSHIFDTEFRNYLRVGYKQVFSQVPIEFVSAGLSAFTTFKGFNGLSPEVTLGWFKIYNTFTIYTRYRYNFQPSNMNSEFHEITIGLYSNFFSINL